MLCDLSLWLSLSGLWLSISKDIIFSPMKSALRSQPHSEDPYPPITASRGQPGDTHQPCPARGGCSTPPQSSRQLLPCGVVGPQSPNLSI